MSAPSFSSFPPSFSSFPDLEPGPSTRPSEQSKVESSRHKKKRRHKSKERKHKRSHGREDAFAYDYPMDDEERKFKDDLKYTSQETSRIYYSDRKGDPYNIQYGGLHSGDVPKYHIVGRGRNILGLSYAWTATYRSGKGVEVGLGGRRKMPSLTDSSARALLAAPPTRRIPQSVDIYKHQEIDGYLQLPVSRRRDEKEQSYRSITVSKGDSDSEFSDASDHIVDDEISADEAGEVTLTAHQERLKVLEQQLNEDPASVDKWLQLLSHSLSTIPITSKNATKARAEISISVLARALSAHPRNADSKLLRVRYLKAGEEVWHESKVRAEWEEALKLGGAEIWMEWLEWRITRGNAGLDGVVDDAVRILGLLGQSEGDEMAKVRVFWRVAVAFQNAGFSERATAMFQAQAELMYEVPEALYGIPHETQLDQLEEFWESEVPRVGEEGSRGWAAWVSSGRKERGSHPSKVTAEEAIELDPYRQWAARESQADRVQFLPARSTDDTDDPYSTVLFSDIKPLLIHLETERAKNAFRRAWLSLLGLHIPGFPESLSSSTEINWDDRWNQGYLTRRSYLDTIFPIDAMQTRLMTEAVAGVIVGREKEYANEYGPVKSWGYGVFGPLDSPAIDRPEKGKAKVGMWGREDVEGLDEGFVTRVFAQLRLGADDVEWDLLTLAFEAALNVKRALKHSRTLLSQKESLPLWAAHAQLETMRGRLDDARKVYHTILIASSAAPSFKGTSALWWNWAHMEWLTGNSTQALNVVLRAGRAEGQGGVAILRCKRSLDDAIKDEPHWKEREGWIKLRALLELLTGADTSAALDVFDHHLFGERKKGIRHESLTVSCLLMVYQHKVLLKNPMPPSVLRQRVEKALDEYPSNSVILGLFLEGERGQGVWGRVRGALGESGGKAKDVARRVQEVWIASWERGRWSGEVERTRSGLSGAVENERTRASHIIWRIYIEFEIRAGQLQRAKKLLFRAIGECPLVKDLYLLAFGPLREVFSGQELGAIADTMAERGLRLRYGLDDVLGGWKVEMEDRASEWDSGTDEIMDNARELRRLMPYS
ncbi:putative NRDE-2, necessary for RNA interference [Lyophyllum shimeji]|uniref:NRDE-2, necessary for RNA interference n=1 Tax=Lyophyllum shimeji TaxID=47721 RepID=A0A9P3UK44_LYOSH|nr:putative NRDE-2, necessary for RNA interference [Lyophyllum shimeji]